MVGLKAGRLVRWPLGLPNAVSSLSPLGCCIRKTPAFPCMQTRDCRARRYGTRENTPCGSLRMSTASSCHKGPFRVVERSAGGGRRHTGAPPTEYHARAARARFATPSRHHRSSGLGLPTCSRRSPRPLRGLRGQTNCSSPVHTTTYIQSYILAMSDRIFACDVET